MPRIVLESVEDNYTYYVNIIGLSDDVFWNTPCWFVREAAENLMAYQGWLEAEKERELEKQKRKSRR